MTAQEAYKIITQENPNMSVMECLEFPEFYAFALATKGKEKEQMGGGYETVHKHTGEIGGFSPVRDFKAFFSATPININDINK